MKVVKSVPEIFTSMPDSFTSSTSQVTTAKYRSETLGALIGALARQFGPLDEGGEVGAGDLYLDAGFLHLEYFAGHDREVQIGNARRADRSARAPVRTA